MIRSLRTAAARFVVAVTISSFTTTVWAQAPAGYYATVDTTNATTLRTTLHAVIDDHTKISYTASGTDTWNVLAAASEDPTNPANILDVYGNTSAVKQTGGNSFYDREHTWPNSYGFPNDGATNYPYTDCHMLFLCLQAYNSTRGNAPYRNCPSGCSELTTTLNAGMGGGSGPYPGNSNWSNGSTSTGTFEVWIGRRGDVARAILYADVRYEGGTHGVTGASEPDLIVTDNTTLIANSATGSNLSVAYMGLKTVLLAWHQQDPPDAWERRRNDVIASYQGNRNPFVDHPEVLRGLVNGSMRDTAERMQRLIGERRVAVQIDPQAFDRFSIVRTPSFVLVRSGASAQTCSSGTCLASDQFVMTAGDVSLDYALSFFERSAPAMARDASSFLQRMKGASR